MALGMVEAVDPTREGADSGSAVEETDLVELVEASLVVEEEVMDSVVWVQRLVEMVVLLVAAERVEVKAASEAEPAVAAMVGKRSRPCKARPRGTRPRSGMHGMQSAQTRAN